MEKIQLNPEISKGLYIWGEFDQESVYLMESLKKSMLKTDTTHNNSSRWSRSSSGVFIYQS